LKIDKEEHISEFMYRLSDFIDEKVSDAMADCHDSYTGWGAHDADEKMRKALYELFEIGEEDE